MVNRQAAARVWLVFLLPREGSRSHLPPQALEGSTWPDVMPARTETQWKSFSFLTLSGIREMNCPPQPPMVAPSRRLQAELSFESTGQLLHHHAG
jgi:hypothetical protein